MTISKRSTKRTVSARLRRVPSMLGGARGLALLAVVTALLLRLPSIDYPPGLYHDEAWYGLDAIGTLEEGARLWYPANNGREPLFIWIVAPFVALLGASPAALRLPAALAGALATAAIYPVGVRLAGRRAGALGAWLMAVTPWAVMLGRSGLRVSLLPAVLLAATSAALVLSHRPSTRGVLAAGALAGLTLYTYTAARVLPLVALIAIGIIWAEARHLADHQRSLTQRMIVMWLVGAIAVSTPLLSTLATTPGGLMGRAAQVSVLREATDQAPDSSLEAVLRSAAAAAGVFVLRGDEIPRHNIPGRPAFGVVAAVLWLLGLAWAAWNAARRPGRNRAQSRVILASLVLTLVPTALAEDAPHFLRASAALPVGLLMAAVGASALESILRSLGRRRSEPGSRSRGRAGSMVHWVSMTILVLAILVEGAASIRLLDAVERPISTDPAGNSSSYYAFEGGATDLARDVNRVLGVGWSGGWTTASAEASRPETRDAGAHSRNSDQPAVWLDRRLRDGWASIPFLVPMDRLTLSDPYDPILDRPGVAFLAPEGLDLDQLWSRLPSGVRLVLESGAPERGDLALDARTMWVRVEALPEAASMPSASSTGVGLRLVDSTVDIDKTGSDSRHGDDIVRVMTRWRKDAVVSDDLTLYVHVRGPGGQRAGNDAPFGFGVYPVARWDLGRDVSEVRSFRVPGGLDPDHDRVFIGLYEWPSTDRLPLQDGSGLSIGTEIQVWPETTSH